MLCENCIEMLNSPNDCFIVCNNCSIIEAVNYYLKKSGKSERFVVDLICEDTGKLFKFRGEICF